MRPTDAMGSPAARRSPGLAAIAQAARFRRGPVPPNVAAEGSRRAIGSSINIPASVGGGFRWGGQVMHSPDEAFAYSQQHGSHLSRGQFFDRYQGLEQMGRPQEAGAGHLAGAVEHGGAHDVVDPAMAQTEEAAIHALEGGSEIDPGFNHGPVSPNVLPHLSDVHQAMLVAHVLHRLHGIAGRHQRPRAGRAMPQPV